MMKRHLLLVLVAMWAAGAQAQLAKIPMNSDALYQFISKSMSADGVARLVAAQTVQPQSADDGSYDASQRQVRFTVYDADFKEEKSFAQYARATSQNRSRTRTATSAVVAFADTTDITEEVWTRTHGTITRAEMYVTEEDMEKYYAFYNIPFERTENGDYYDLYYNTFFGRLIFGKLYPYYYVHLDNGRALRVNVRQYLPCYDGAEWKEQAWTNYESAKNLVCKFEVRDLDEEKGHFDAQPMIVSQGLFNDDDKYEYIRPLRIEGREAGDLYSFVDNGEVTFETEMLERRMFGIAGYEVVSEDGTSVFAIEVKDDSIYFNERNEILILRMNGQLYFVVVAECQSDSSNDVMLVYRLNRATGVAEQVELPQAIRIAPSLVRRNTPVTIRFTQPITEPAQVFVTALDGKVVARRDIRVGEESIQVQTSGLTSGLYNFTVYSNGRKLENGKVMVQ